MTDNRNVIIAIVLSLIVLLGWQYFVAGPQMERAQRAAELAAANQPTNSLAVPAGATGATAPASVPNAAGQTFATRDAAITATPRLKIDTAALAGSINLKNASIDDLELKQYRETVDPQSPIITLLTPSGAPNGYFVEQGWALQSGENATANASWTADNGATTLTENTPVTLSWDNGAGLVFHRTFAVDSHFLFTVTQTIENRGTQPVTMFPYSRIVREGTPVVHNFFVQHEGPLGVLGNLISKKYTDIQSDQQINAQSNGGWLGFGDKYWATAVMPPRDTPISARFSWKKQGNVDVYETNYVNSTAVTVAPGATAASESYVFAGAKEEAVISSYEQSHGFDRLELLIDWGWLHFLTKPMFYLLRFLYGVIGNFGLAILAVTVIVKAIFFPLANRSYASMAAMRRVQPEMKQIQERFKEDRAAQQQAMMELYKREKINPISGCLPILVQIPVFFSLYTVLFISLEMRHAPFFGWIQDLAAPDPTNIFTLFGLIPWDPTQLPLIGHFLALGVWPLVMGVTMWVQMQLNPPPPDPTQAKIFAFMPIIFTFMLGTFPAGLVIYWAWNNFLSITQQWIIMKRHGAEVHLFSNIANMFRRKPAGEKA